MLFSGVSAFAAPTITPIGYDPGRYEGWTSLSEGLIGVYDENGNGGYINQAGEIIIPMQFNYCYDFNDGIARVTSIIGTDAGGNNTYDTHYIDKNGNFINDEDYGKTRDFSEGLAGVEKDGLFGFINTNGELVIDYKYDAVQDFEGGVAIVETADGVVLIDKSGNEVSDYHGAIFRLADDRFLAGVDEVFGFTPATTAGALMDETGKLYTDFIYSSMAPYSDGLSKAFKDGVSSYINMNGEEELVVADNIKLAGDFSEGLAPFDGGYINKSGEIVISADYDYLGKFSNGYAVVENHSDYTAHVIDKNGNIVSPEVYNNATDFEDGHSVARKGELSKAGLIDTNFNTILPFEYAYIYYQGDNIFIGEIQDENTYKSEFFIIDLNDGITINKIIAISTPSAILMDSEEISMEAYNIDGNNYFKLRDLASLVNGTEKQFEISWNGETNAIDMTSGENYTAVGGEMGKGDGVDKEGTESTASVYLDGEKISLTAYNIGGNNYFKLRDVADVIDFGVIYDEATKNIRIDTSSSYVD